LAIRELSSYRGAAVHAGNGHLRGLPPAVSFTKAIDVWMATCLVFVFGSFIEYSVVNVLARREKMNQQLQQPPPQRPPNIIEHNKLVRGRRSEDSRTSAQQ